jgi:hypothetical protein
MGETKKKFTNEDDSLAALSVQTTKTTSVRQPKSSDHQQWALCELPLGPNDAARVSRMTNPRVGKNAQEAPSGPFWH